MKLVEDGHCWCGKIVFIYIVLIALRKLKADADNPTQERHSQTTKATPQYHTPNSKNIEEFRLRRVQVHYFCTKESFTQISQYKPKMFGIF